MTLDHEKLNVYRHALALLKICDEIIQHLPKGRAHVKEQLEDAATSVVANTAEGAGEFSGKEKARFYRMARRSATEIAAWVDIIAKRREAPEPLLQRARHELEIVVPMLVKLVRTCER
ncbi:MAG TPA: four helix bundle protein [Polyangiales bacterium]|nr:four helix bundle protein [Polyangiales bacterium]